MTEKIVDFRVQLLIILHCFSDLISIIIMIENDNVDLFVEVIEADMIMIMKLIEGMTEKNNNF